MSALAPAADPLAPRLLAGLRLPAWALPAGWPRTADGQPALADLHLDGGHITAIRAHGAAAGGAGAQAGQAGQAVNPGAAPDPGALACHGQPALPGLVEPHAHLDKTFTLARTGPVAPGLLAAIDAMERDRPHWTADDLRHRATQALQWAEQAGVVRLRTHVDWRTPPEPLAWSLMAELAAAWAPAPTRRGGVAIDRAALIPQPLFADRSAAFTLARAVAAGGPGARLGGFIHSHHWDASALRHLIEAAEEHGLDIDLHVDEELNPEACGLLQAADLARDIGYSGRLVCSHACAIAAQPDAVARATLDTVARAPITLVCLPLTNLLLQDAATGRTPRQRGLTLVKEARARGIPVLIGSDNVQDPFCPIGSYDPLEAFATGVAAAQLDDPFDTWTEALCRADWLTRAARPGPRPLQPGDAADLVLFTQAQARGWPSRSHARRVMRGGRWLHAA